jgi:hypothetical protein
MAEDPACAAAEYLAQFRVDLEAYVRREAVEACVSAGVYERGALREFSYAAFVDPSGGSSDSMTLCIGHYEAKRETVVIDCLREVRPPFSPETVVSEFATVLKSYRLIAAAGDRYAGEWPVEQFGKYGIRYEAAAKPKSELYGDLLPLLNSKRVELLDHPKAINQISALERRTARGGKDSIDHPPNGHDDVANAIAGCAQLCTIQGTYNLHALVSDLADGENDRDTWRRMRRHQHIMSQVFPR